MSYADGHFECQVYGEYARESGQAQNNALLSWAILGELYGWTLQAFCGYWGNVGAEGGYNPWRWEWDQVPNTYGSLASGYGLVQWTPATKYINAENQRIYGNRGYGPNFLNQRGSYDDGWAQTHFMEFNEGQWSSNVYNMTYSEYKHSTADPRDLAEIWLRSFEKPEVPNPGPRRSNAEYWWNFITSGAPIGPDQPSPDPPPLPPEPGTLVSKSKFIFYLKPYWKRGL